MEFLLHKRNGEFLNHEEYRNYTRDLPDGRYLIEVNSAKKRSHPQNNFYWSVVVPLVYNALRDAGFDSVKTKEDAHMIMRTLFLKTVEERDGMKIEKILSTTELTTVGFMEYLQNISIWAADYLSMAIPEPGQQLRIVE